MESSILSPNETPQIIRSIYRIHSAQLPSKYDFVKVRVWLTPSRFYVLSRYLICRSLVGTKIHLRDAVCISIEVKRTLVDMELLDILQEQFEDYLYKTMKMFGYNEENILRYRMITSFHQRRHPLLIVIAGTKATGKSNLAKQLCSRMNISNVIHTDMVLELMKSEVNDISDPNYQSTVNHKEFGSNFLADCFLCLKGMRGDIIKCFREGKSVMVEGQHIDPAGFQMLLHEVQSMDQYGIVVPLIVTLDLEEHNFFIANAEGEQDKAKSTEFITVANDIHSIEKTTELLHDEILQKIKLSTDSWSSHCVNPFARHK